MLEALVAMAPVCVLILAVAQAVGTYRRKHA
ncbi:MAG: hypothetical protein A4E67_00898 [Syntrophaceae bacterium PtaB.Bin038]|jgi:hypothetical protein|nr:MAG: hypothetical protein A4E67_00898 [Syntrophaceae bacterium PtaB.Bin038]